MKKKQYQVILFTMVFSLTKYCYCQEYDTIAGFTHYRANNIEIEKVMDEMINIADHCPYFSELQKKYYIWLALDSGKCEAGVLAQNLTCLYYFKHLLPDSQQGVCFYNNHIIHLQFFNRSNDLERYFIKNDSIVDIFFEKNDNYFEHIVPANMHFHCTYLKDAYGRYSRTTHDDDFEESCGLNDRMEFSYMVRLGDTWELIAKKAKCPEEQLRNEYREFKDPIPGTVLFFVYTFDNKGNFLTLKRIFY